MGKVLGKVKLQKALEHERTFKSLGQVLWESEKSVLEVGGECYISKNHKSSHVNFRLVPHKYTRFLKYFQELREGNFVQKHFNKMLRVARSYSDHSVNTDGWINLARIMKEFKENPYYPGEARTIADKYQKELAHTYVRPERKRLRRGKMFAEFHLHNNNAFPSGDDIGGLQFGPQIIIVYDGDVKIQTDDGYIAREVHLVYIHKKKEEEQVEFRSRFEEKVFGPYNVILRG